LAARARPCASRTRLFEINATPNGALRAPPRPSHCCFLFDPQKYIKSIELGPPTLKLFSFHWTTLTTEAMKYEFPCPHPDRDHTPQFFFVFFFFLLFMDLSFWLFSSFSSLLFNFFLFFSFLFLSFSSFLFLFFS
jgi:hypothetical protein